MRKTFFTAALLSSLAFASPAYATIILADNFDAEAGGTTALNYNGFANFNVESDIGLGSPVGTASVDVLREPNGFGLPCAGGAGSSCVDLDGSTGNGGRLVTNLAYAVSIGDIVTLTLDLAGSRRGSTENFGFGFRTDGAAMDFLDITAQIPGLVNVAPTNLTGAQGFFAVTNNLGSGYGYTSSFVRFRAGTAGSIRAFAQTSSNDNVGPLIDNFTLDVTAVPEPASWAMMIAGFGLVGSAMRRRKPLAKHSFA